MFKLLLSSAKFCNYSINIITLILITVSKTFTIPYNASRHHINNEWIKRYIIQQERKNVGPK